MKRVNTAGKTVACAPLEHDWRFAELVAATWLEPGLNTRYAHSPEAVLAEFGIVLAEGETAPRLPAAPELQLTVDDFEQLPELTSEAAVLTWCTAPSASMAGTTLPAGEAAGA